MPINLSGKRLTFEKEVSGKPVEDLAYIDKVPDACPSCENGIVPVFITSYGSEGGYTGYEQLYLQVVFRCPKESCQMLFLSFYTSPATTSHKFSGDDWYVFLQNTLQLNPYHVSPHFEDKIKSISPMFVSIYTQAHVAEQNKLDLICGPGYRKSLEFLLKDYLIKTKQGKKSVIGKELLGIIIDRHISDKRIKEMAKRATWIGNDETHYIRKWQKMDIEDLKNLIKLTLNYVSTDLLAKDYLKKLGKYK